MRTAHHYAQALMHLTATGETPARAVERTRALLARHGHEQTLPRIARALQQYAQRDRVVRGTTLLVARDADEAAARKESGHYLKEKGVSESDVQVRIDNSLIGGWRLFAHTMHVDASFKRALVELYQRIRT